MIAGHAERAEDTTMRNITNGDAQAAHGVCHLDCQVSLCQPRTCLQQLVTHICCNNGVHLVSALHHQKCH